MGVIIQFPCVPVHDDWEEIFDHECAITGAGLHVFRNTNTGAVDVVSTYADDSITVHLQANAAGEFARSLEQDERKL